MKKIKLLSLIMSILLVLSLLIGCTPVDELATDDELITEMKGCFDFFWNEVQIHKTEAYGLIADRAGGNVASTASIGYGLAAITIGVERGWINQQEGQERALGTINTMLNIPNVNGFYYHFLNMNTGARDGKCELSVIDSAIMVIGALIAGQYFGGQVQEAANMLYSNVNWKWYVGNNNGKQQFRMSYDQNGSGQFAGWWDFYAEQLMLYVLGAGSPNAEYRTDKTVYDGFKRVMGSYINGEYFIYSWFGSLFTYQFSHAFIDFRQTTDGEGVNWFNNSVTASRAAYQYCVDKSDTIASFSTKSWGLTACDYKWGYSGYLGTPPRGWSPSNYNGMPQNGATGYGRIEGTVAPCAALGSMPFTPIESKKALKYYLSIPEINGSYGLRDSFDLVNDWYSTSYIGIDKGVTILMLSNYLDGFIWEISNQITYIQDGLNRIGITRGN